jgi:hypothetical protein
MRDTEMDGITAVGIVDPVSGRRPRMAAAQHLDLVAAAPLFGHATRHDAMAVRGADAAMVI